MAPVDLEHLTQQLCAELDVRLADADALLAAEFPGDQAGRQPVHTVYVPAGRYDAQLTTRWGAQALAALDRHRELFAELVDDDAIVSRVRDKLAREPVEDLRIDFEDGYGTRSDEIEDRDAAAAAHALAASASNEQPAPFCGIRIKSLEPASRRRGVRTLVIFAHAYRAAGARFDNFVITLPKLTSVEQAEAMAGLCGQLEHALGGGRLRFEIQVETPQCVLGPDGTALVAKVVHASAGRCVALHYGTYDYSAACDIAARDQSLAHPAADHAKLVMQAAAAGTGVRLSDGSTNILPVGEEASVRRGWELHLKLIRRSLERGYYQGWDLHPAQLPSRYAATFAFYREGLSDAGARLRAYLERAASAILDEPATARALAGYLLRARECGAVTRNELEAATGAAYRALRKLAQRASTIEEGEASHGDLAWSAPVRQV